MDLSLAYGKWTNAREKIRDWEASEKVGEEINVPITYSRCRANIAASARREKFNKFSDIRSHSR